MSEMRREGLLVSYHPELLWADSMGERELPSGSDNSSLPTSNQPSLSPWSHAPTRPLLPDGRDSLFGLLQPSDTRRIELAVPFEPKAAERQAIALERSQVRNLALLLQPMECAPRTNFNFPPPSHPSPSTSCSRSQSPSHLLLSLSFTLVPTSRPHPHASTSRSNSPSPSSVLVSLHSLMS